MDEKHAILVIDGKVVSRKFYTRLLDSFFAEKYNILDVETGIKGIVLCTKRPVDCVLVACRLPDQTGLEFISQLMERISEEREVPIVMLAEEDNEEEAKSAIKLGAFDYLVKGRFSPVSLVQTVKNAMQAAELHRELAKSRMRLLENAHKAGMAEIANGVLHNIGNHMNSVATSVDTISATLERSRLKGLKQANAMLESMEDLLKQHPKGINLLRYYKSLEEKWDVERESVVKESKFLMERVTNIRNDIYEQTHYANAELFMEELDLNKIVVDALRLSQAQVEELGIRVDERCSIVPHCMSVRVKVMLILNNLIKNGLESLEETQKGNRMLSVGTFAVDKDHCCIFVADNGDGIPDESAEKIFNYGFTTKLGANGVGLHVAHNAATELGGKLNYAPDGHGARFELVLPINQKVAHDDGAAAY